MAGLAVPALHDVSAVPGVADGEPGVAVSAEMLRPPHELTLPCCNVFRIRDGLVSGYRLCVDINAVNE